MAPKTKQEAQNPLILRSLRLIEAFSKSDDERDFYLDRLEGFIIYVDLDKPQNEIEELELELSKGSDRYCLIPKLTFYETKKIMEGFVTEKVYDIDTKEKLLDIIQSKEARMNFIEFLYDHHAELEKWQLFFQERSRIRIIEWLRQNHFHFVFEEDLELAGNLVDKLKQNLFQAKVGKDVLAARKTLVAKAKTYYSNEALNPRPKRGRPPKQAVKQEVEAQITTDVYLTIQPVVRPFFFAPDIMGTSNKYENDDSLFTGKRPMVSLDSSEASLESINLKLAELRGLSQRWVDPKEKFSSSGKASVLNFDDGDDEEDEDFEDDFDEDFDDEEDVSPKTARRAQKKAPVKPAKSSKEAQKSAPKAKPKAKAPAKKELKTEKAKPAKKKIVGTRTKPAAPEKKKAVGKRSIIAKTPKTKP